MPSYVKEVYSAGECFVVLPPNCAENTVIFGRNSIDDEGTGEAEAQEVVYYDANTASEGKCDGGAEPEVIGSLRVILQKPLPGVWGGDYGANEKNVCIGISWLSDEPEDGSGHLLATDIVRYTLAAATSAADAIEQIGLLIATHGSNESKASYVVCDASEVWFVNCFGKLWAAQRCTEGHVCSKKGFTITTSIDKCSEGLIDTVKSLGLWDGEGDFNFATSCGIIPCNTQSKWSGEEPSGDGTYSLTNMFRSLRRSTKDGLARSATVSILSGKGISCHWFTATPNPSESVFKPFVFAPNPKISPLTKVPAGEKVTLLHKLHANRKAAAIEDLKCLEASCVDEVNTFLEENPSPTEELDELMKDCVEAEVKFYR